MPNQTKDFYNENVERWTSKKVNSFHHEIPFREFEQLMGEGDTVLDIGCASGIHVPLFFGIGRKLKYEGVDVSEKMIEIAESRYPQLDFRVADILEYDPKKVYDGFWSAATLMHLPEEDHEKLFSKIESLVKPGAYGYLTVPSERPNPESETDRRHFTLFPKGKFESIAQERSWKIINTGTLLCTNENPIWNWYIVKLPG